MTSQSRIPRRGAWIAIVAATVACAATVHAAADHLLISEVLVKERPGVTSYGSEYVEITNAGVAAADLAQVYLTDAGNSLNATTFYYNIVTGGGAGGGGSSGDFHARFPAGATLAPGASVVVALRGSAAFQTSHGRLPDYELFEDGLAPDAVPELVEAFPGSIGFGLGNGSTNVVPTSGWLDDVSETLVMYQWDGATDLVADLDYLTWGTSSTLRINKSGVSVDGPDADGVASAYLADTAVGSQQALTTIHSYGDCFQRLGTDEGAETATGGNGLTGHDETSEDLTATWNTAADQDPTSTGTASPATPLVTAAETSPATPFNTLPVTVTATVLSASGNAASSVSLIWRTDADWTTVAASGAGDTWSAQIPALPTGTVVQWYVTAVGTAGGPSALPHGAPLYVRAYTVQQAPDPGDSPPHLLMTEVCVQGSDHEFIEIFNPTDETVELDNYYVTDAVYNTQGYWLLPAGNPSSGTIGGGTFTDFQARFPAGATIEPGEALTLSLAGSEKFQTVWGVAPDFEIREDGASADAIPNMREVFPGSLQGDETGAWATLTNTAEIVVLYYWNGASNLVTDIDMFMWGSSTSARVDKTGVSVNGSTYAADTPVASQDQFMLTHDILGSFQRLDPQEGTETETGGNGPLGHDETSENISGTWAAADGTPGVFGEVELVITSATLTPSHPQPGEAGEVTVAVTGTAAVAGVSLRYALDGGTFTDVACADNGDGTWSGTIPGQADGVVVAWYVTATGSGGASVVWPEGGASSPQTYTVETIIPGEGLAKLLLTEVCVQGSDHEFIEIYNPTDEVVELDNFYLTDAIHNAQGYWLLPAGNPSSGTIGGGTFTDFQARFPAGATIEPGEALTLSLAGSEKFQTVWGVAPDFEIREDGASADAIPNMREVFPGSLQGDETGAWATLTNAGEIVVLYYWDGVSDLVTDIDMFMWGSSTSARVDKTGVSVNGSTYAADTPVASQDQFMLAHNILGSFQRLDPAEGTETETGGNGHLGHDETSENVSGTWNTAAGTPGVYEVVELAVTAATLAPQHPQPGQDAVVTAAVTGTAAVSGVTLRFSLDGGAFTDVVCTNNGNGTWSGTIPAQAEGVEVAWYVTAAGAGGASALWPVGGAAAAPTYTVETLVPGYGLAKLLLTKVCTLGTDAEFVEICNPNTFDVPLRNYYLTDAVYYESQAYWNLPNGTPSRTTLGGGAFTDFLAKFPDEAVLAAGDTITVSIAGSQNYLSEWGVLPYYELFEDDDYEDAVVDMREVFPGSINGEEVPTLTNLSDNGDYINGEIVALFFWDGLSDLVTDIDVFIWGEANAYSVVKTGITIGASTYAAEAGYPDPFMTEHASGEAYVRVDATEGTQEQSGSNGFEGADETSENLSTTWGVQVVTPVAPPMPEGSGEVTLGVPAKTFLASRGETFRITFTASPGAETVLRIIDLNGRLVRHLYDSRFDGDASIVPDTPSIRVWDGRNETYELARAGMYVVHLQVTDPRTGKRIEKTAPAVVSTRLSN